VIEVLRRAQQRVGSPDGLHLRQNVREAGGAVQPVAITGLHEERPRGDERGNVPHVHVLVQVRHIVAGAVLVAVQQGFLVSVQVAADHRATHALVEGAGPQGLQAPSGQSGDPQPLGVAVRARLDVVDESMQVPRPHPGHRLSQWDRHVVQPLAGSLQEISLGGAFLPLAKAAGVRAEDDEPCPHELHAVVIVVLINRLGEFRSQAQAGHGEFAARRVPMGRDHHREGSRSRLRDQHIKRHDHPGLRGDLQVLPDIVPQVLFSVRSRAGRRTGHRVVAGDAAQGGARRVPPDLPFGPTGGGKGHPAADAVETFPHVWLRHQAHRVLVLQSHDPSRAEAAAIVSRIPPQASDAAGRRSLS